MKQIYEIFEEFEAMEMPEEKIQVLRNNATYALKMVLLGTFRPDIQFDVEIPPYKKVEMPPGMSYSSLQTELRRVYLFEKGNPKRPPGLTPARQRDILIQILETLEEKEAMVFAGMLRKDLGVPGLTAEVAEQAFPGLMAQPLN